MTHNLKNTFALKQNNKAKQLNTLLENYLTYDGEKSWKKSQAAN